MFKQNQSFLILFLSLSVFIFLIAGCVTPFSELQSARMAGPGKVEVTPSLSAILLSNNGEISHVHNNIGIQVAMGVSRFMDFRVRYERVSAETMLIDLVGINVLGFGPKFSLVKNRAALYMPIGFAFGKEIEASETWQFHPTLLFTLPINRYLELNPSAKALIPFKNPQSSSIALNLGAGLSTNLNRWAIRPELGFLFKPGTSGFFMQFSLGFSIYIR